MASPLNRPKLTPINSKEEFMAHMKRKRASEGARATYSVKWDYRECGGNAYYVEMTEKEAAALTKLFQEREVVETFEIVPLTEMTTPYTDFLEIVEQEMVDQEVFEED